MADSKSPESNKKTPQFPLDVAAEENLSVEDIDLALAEEDPEFAKQIAAIGLDKELSLSQIDISSVDQALHEERDKWENSPRIIRIWYKAFPFIARISLLLKRIKFYIFAILRSLLVRAKNFAYYLVTEGRRNAIGGIKGFFGKIAGSISDFGRYFRYLPWTTKLVFFGMIGLAGFTGLFIYRSMTTGVIAIDDDLFLPSLEKVADETITYDPDKETEAFYENLRVSNNLLLITRMVVNLKPSGESGSNPMGAFEFYVEGSSPEVVVEAKDREVEIRDRMQRALEELTFDFVDSAAGKEMMLEKLKKEINSLLTTGKIKRVFIKTAIIKP